MTPLFRYEKFVTRAMVRAEPDTLFVFGDNLERRGLGGQAREMRGSSTRSGSRPRGHPIATRGHSSPTTTSRRP